MRYIPRLLEKPLRKAAKQFPALILTGSRRAGKTTLLRRTFPNASYWLLEDPDRVARFRADPHGFLDEVRLPAILDEIQNVPEILNYVRSRIDAVPTRKGQWFLTGPQEAPLMRGVTESLAGRAAVFQLLPLSNEESPKVSMRLGGFPEVIAASAAAGVWFRSYIQTYLERDVRAVSSIRDLSTFRRFLALVATRTGQILNKTDLAAPLGVGVPTVAEWLSILEITGQIQLVPPFFENFGKRLIKSPKLYFVDTGLDCHLLGVETARELEKSPFLGPIFESFVAGEIVKRQVHRGRAKELFFFREQQGLEVDFVVPLGNRRLLLVEAKATHTPRPALADSLARLANVVGPYQPLAFLVHRRKPNTSKILALRPGVRAGEVADLISLLR